MRIMTLSSRPSRWLAFVLACLVSLGAWSTPGHAGQIVGPPGATCEGRAAPTVLMGGFMDSVVGNRQRMIQFAFIGFAIGIAILVTATRKH